MHRDVEVAEFNLDEGTGHIGGNIRVLNFPHMPPGTVSKKRFLDPLGLSKWWIGRCIPMSRTEVHDLLDPLGISLLSQLLTKSMGLSLSDSYWVRERSSDACWEDINLFDKGFSEDVGLLLFGQDVDTEHIDFLSPDVTTEGNLRKRWTIIDGRRCPIKGGSGTYKQEPFNEAIASCICRELGIQHVDYDVLTIDGFPYSICEDFVDGKIEYIAASHILESYGSLGSESVYDKFVRVCSLLDLDIVPFLNDMMVLDYIIANDDRHLNNFGLLRDAETLEWLGPAPMYDCGSSLGYNFLTSEFATMVGRGCKPFKRTFEEQIRLARGFDASRLDSVADAIPGIGRILDSAAERLGTERTEAIAAMISDRTESARRALTSTM